MEPTQPYELKDLNELKPNAKNPRRISPEDFAALKASIKKFGDLSCVVFNTRTQQLVGGHQRVEAIKTMHPPAKVMIMERFAQPDARGTVALGTIWIDNEQYKYREVDWDEGTEKAANVAANRIQGEFDLDLLAQLDYELSQLPDAGDLLKLTGQSEKEVERLLASVGVNENGEEQPDELGPDPHDSDKREIRATREQWEIIDEALENIKATKEIPAESNSSRNGGALYYLARDYLDRLHGLADEPSIPPAA